MCENYICGVDYLLACEAFWVHNSTKQAMGYINLNDIITDGKSEEISRKSITMWGDWLKRRETSDCFEHLFMDLRHWSFLGQQKIVLNQVFFEVLTSNLIFA